MNVWAVRGGADGEYEDYALREGVTMVDFGLRRDATEFEDRDALRDYLVSETSAYGGNPRRAGNAASQIWKFAAEIQTGDMLLLPRKKTKTIAVGKVTGEYRLDEGMPFDACHARAVEWSARDVSRDDLDDDIIKVIRSMLTVFQVRPEGAAERIESVVASLAAAPEPEEETPDGDDALPPAPAEESPPPSAVESVAEEPSLDSLIEERVIRRVRRAFPGARLSHLVASILRGYGYTVAITSPSDEKERVHILAGRGDMGFDGPGLLAHLSLGDEPASAEDCQRLRENARAVGAQRCLLVSMAGFSDPARQENERSFFTTRLWDAGEVAANLMENYDRLPPDIRAAVPMQTRRTLVEA